MIDESNFKANKELSNIYGFFICIYKFVRDLVSLFSLYLSIVADVNFEIQQS